MGIGSKLIKGIGLGIIGYGSYAYGKNKSDNTGEPLTPISQDVAQQEGQTAQDFSDENNSPQSTFKSTNIAGLDEMLKNGTITPEAAFYANRRLGLNVADYGNQVQNVNMNAKLQMKKDADALNELANTSLMIDNAISLSEGNLGLGGAWDRFWNKNSGKWLDLSDRGAQFQSANHNIIRQYAKAIKGGKPSNQDIKDLEEIYGLGAVGEGNYAERMYQMKFDIADKMERQIETLIAQGRPVPPNAYLELNSMRESLAFLENQIQQMNKGKNFDYKSWATFARRGNFDPRNPKNQVQVQSKQSGGNVYSYTNKDGQKRRIFYKSLKDN